MPRYIALSDRSGHVRIGPLTLVVAFPFNGELVAHWFLESGGPWVRVTVASC
jgi:hypothetical protein